MIPQAIQATEECVGTVFDHAALSLCATNQPDCWLLRVDQDGPAFVLDNGTFQALCIALQGCIDTALKPHTQPGATTLTQTIAHGLRTTQSNDGALCASADWSGDPIIELNCYPGSPSDHPRITLTHALEDAIDFQTQLLTAYSERVPSQ